jgi:hypothetical protein
MLDKKVKIKLEKKKGVEVEIIDAWKSSLQQESGVEWLKDN